MPEVDLQSLKGKRVREVHLGRPDGYEPTALTVVFDDETRLIVEAGSVMYDQYSSSPCLRTHLEQR